MTASSVPAALDAILALATAALPDIPVLDGPPRVKLPRDVVCVGYDGSDETAGQGADVTITHSTMGPRRQEEYDVPVFVLCWRAGAGPGGQDFSAKPARDAAYSIVDALYDAVRTDHTLGGTVLDARMSTATLQQAQLPEAVSAAVLCNVHIRALPDGP